MFCVLEACTFSGEQRYTCAFNIKDNDKAKNKISKVVVQYEFMRAKQTNLKKIKNKKLWSQECFIEDGHLERNENHSCIGSANIASQTFKSDKSR